jgi:hypothetical protein
METKEKIAILNELINRFGLSANPHENDYLFNVLRAIKDDYIEKEKEEIKGISEETAQELADVFEKVRTDTLDLQTCINHIENMADNAWKRTVMNAMSVALDYTEKTINAKWFLPRWWWNRKQNKAFKIAEQQQKIYAEWKLTVEKSRSMRNWGTGKEYKP